MGTRPWQKKHLEDTQEMLSTENGSKTLAPKQSNDGDDYDYDDLWWCLMVDVTMAATMTMMTMKMMMTMISLLLLCYRRSLRPTALTLATTIHALLVFL
jgi:hypothetical protein